LLQSNYNLPLSEKAWFFGAKSRLRFSTDGQTAITFHEDAGLCQVDFDLPFLKFPFPSWGSSVQSGVPTAVAETPTEELK
jgi:hypothetical protein